MRTAAKEGAHLDDDIRRGRFKLVGIEGGVIYCVPLAWRNPERGEFIDGVLAVDPNIPATIFDHVSGYKDL